MFEKLKKLKKQLHYLMERIGLYVLLEILIMFITMKKKKIRNFFMSTLVLLVVAIPPLMEVPAIVV